MAPENPDRPFGNSSPEGETLADGLTAAYGELLELEAERRSLARSIDGLLEAGADEAAIALIRRQRTLVGEINRRREELAGVTKRFRREEAAQRRHDSEPGAS